MMNYSVYVFLDQRGRPYYVGKTNNFKRRRKEHLDEIRKGNTLPKYKKARSLIRQGHTFRMRTIARTRTEEDAFDVEAHFITKYKERGVKLTNVVGVTKPFGYIPPKKKKSTRKRRKKA
jgi:predicted GIY-YIG superfamily endonuclease